jgi:hypothetical protein
MKSNLKDLANHGDESAEKIFNNIHHSQIVAKFLFKSF